MTDRPHAKGCPNGLRGLLLRVWTLADGRRGPAEIAAAAAASAQEVRDALSLLAHVGLMQGVAEEPALPAWFAAAVSGAGVQPPHG